MAHSMPPPPSNYERVFDRLNNSHAEALKYLNFQTSKFDADVGPCRAYYRLTPQERLRLKKFFSDPRQSPASECQSVYKPPGTIYQRRFPPEKYLRGKSAVKERPVTGQTQEIINSGLTDDRKGRSLNHLISKCVNPLQLIEIAAVMRNYQQAHATLCDIRLINKLLHKSVEFRECDPDVPDRLFRLITGLRSDYHPKTCTLLLKLCTRGLNLVNANALLFGGDGSSGLINTWRVELNVPVCNAFITVCAKTGNIDRAWALVSGKGAVMTPERGLVPDAITCVNLLTACAEAGDFDKAVLLLFGNESMPALIQRWGVKLDVFMCNAFITLCGKTGNISAAKADLIKIMNESGVIITAHMKAQPASLVSDKFQETVENGIRYNLYHHNLGVTKNSLNLHIDKIFKTSFDDTDNGTGVTPEFAKLLFCYLKDIRGHHITSIITGYHGKHTLKDGMTTYIEDKYNLTFAASKFNRGELILAEPP